MPRRRLSVLVALVAAGAVLAAVAAGTPPVTVQERPLIKPPLPDDAEMPPNVPEDGAVRLPYVSGGPPGVAQRINTAVWKAMLDGAVAPATPGRTWTPPADRLPQGTMSLRFTARLLPAADPRLLALGFSGEGCGAYCEDFNATHAFDLRDGREVSLGDLLTVDGFAAVARRVDADRRRAFQKQLRDLRATRKSARKGVHDDGDDDDRIEFNETCLAQVASEPSTPEWLVGEDVAPDGRGGLVLTRGRCSNHAMRALDGVGPIATRLDAAELAPWLTPYGRALLRGEGDAPPPAGPGRRELHGQLAGLPITMTLGPLRERAEEDGSYAYDKYRAPIALRVSRDGSQVHAVERSAGAGSFELTIAGGSLVGTWSDKDGRRRLPVILQ